MKRHRRSMLLALLLCCVSVVAMAGIYRREKNKPQEEWEDLMELSEAGEPGLLEDEEVNALIDAAFASETPAPVVTDQPQDKAALLSEEAEKQATEEDRTKEEVAAAASHEVQPAPVLNFKEQSLLTWPVQGEVTMEYSMDHMVYYATLQQYRYNPGMLIQSEEGTMVYAGADARVTGIEQSEELGTCVVMELGNGYTVRYGQLKAVQVDTGDVVAAGSAIGLVAAPTKYYSVEGDHVYIELQKDGTPVDPLEYLD